MTKVGLTTTVPVEIVYAAGMIPIDVNNIFVTHPQRGGLVEQAEIAGYPRNVCGWIKGLYSSILGDPEIKKVIAVTQGDCSNTHALMETLQVQGIEIIPFAYPFDRDADMLELQIKKLQQHFKVSDQEVDTVKERLDKVRQLVWEVDRLTWEDNIVTGFDNHLYQVCCSDFEGDPETFGKQVADFIEKVKREPFQAPKDELRLGYMGVPPIFDDIYDYLEEIGARVVFNEVQRQFSMPFPGSPLVEQYRKYTYPYDVFGRLADIKAQIEQRGLQGLIHYTQSFCFRQIEDIIIRKEIDIPILTIEGDRPGQMDARTKMRIDAFVEMLR